MLASSSCVDAGGAFRPRPSAPRAAGALALGGLAVFLGLALAGCVKKAIPPPAILSVPLPVGQVGTAYSGVLTVTGGTPPYAWALAGGTLPAGLTLNTATGAITGTPTAAVSGAPLTFTVTDSEPTPKSAQATFSITIAPPPIVIGSGFLPNGQAGVAYSVTLTASGGTLPYTWTLTSGTLPSGLTLNAATGAITGTPAGPVNAAPLTFTVTDAESPAQSKQVSLTLTIAPAPLVIASTALPLGEVGAAYSTALSASGGTLPFNWSVTGGALPSGLTLNAATGAITGTPTASASAASLTFTLTDAGSPAQSKQVTLALTIAPALALGANALPNGEVGVSYSATLAASGGVPPYTWTLIGGTLPAGLLLNAATGAITGTPTATASGASLPFAVADAFTPPQSQSSTLTMNISPSPIAVAVTPRRAGVTVNQPLQLTATTNDLGGVTWTATGAGCAGAACGSFSASGSLSGAAVTYTPPSAPGSYTIRATSATDSAMAASVTVGVTDLAGVTTYHNNSARNGANTQEYALTGASVAAGTFGKLFSCTVDGAIYAQPLWMAGLAVGGAKRNVVFVATQHDSVYAFDADTNSSPCTPLWHANLLDAAHGALAGESSVPSSGTGALLGSGNGDIAPEVGVTGTPVIDPATNTLYVVSKSVIAAGPTFYQRLHAIDLLTGTEKFAGPVTIAATYPGTGDGGTTTSFAAQPENQRPGLALANGIVYIAWASHEDSPPYYGWVIGYSASDLSQAAVFNDAPNVGYGGIWMSGGAPSVDAAGRLYLITGNATFDAASATPPNNDYGDSFLRMGAGLTVEQYFTPSDEATDNGADQDFGSGGAAVLADLPANGTHPTHLVIGGGKDGYLYLLDRDKMGGLGDANAWERMHFSHGIFATGAFWNSYYYLAGVHGPMQSFWLDPASALLGPQVSASTMTFGFPGATPSITSTPANANGIVWALDQSQYCTPGSPGCGPAVLHAFDAAQLDNELWNSAQVSGDAAGYAVKFTVPTVANGKVYVGTRGNNTGDVDTSTAIPGELDVYGLLPN